MDHFEAVSADEEVSSEVKEMKEWAILMFLPGRMQRGNGDTL